MKRTLSLFVLLSALFVGFGCVKTVSVNADEDSSEVEISSEVVESSEVVSSEIEETYTAWVEVGEIAHAKYALSAEKGNIGDEVVLRLQQDLFYVCDYIKLNGVELVEDEETIGKYTFTLQAGLNKIEGKYIIDEETLGEFSDMYAELANHDWKNLFSITNVITILNWLLSGGLLIAVVRYFIKDKKLETQVENAIKENINNVIPDSTRKSVVATVEEVLSPLIGGVSNQVNTIQDAMVTLSKCMALMQENTPESRLAVLEALEGIQLADKEQIEKSRTYIEELVAKVKEIYNNTLAKIEVISENSKVVAESGSGTVQEVTHSANLEEDNGTRI